MVRGVADGIDTATASREVRAVVIRGEGRVFTAGYDLVAVDAGAWSSPYDAPGPRPREGAWDPVRDWQFMGANVDRFMKIWHCPKPVLGEIHGFAVGGATDQARAKGYAGLRVDPEGKEEVEVIGMELSLIHI